MNGPIAIRFEDREIMARAGQSIGAALAAAGVHGLRQTRLGPDRGLFCGMGVCQDCLVTVDGVPNLRACMTEARAGSRVTRQCYPGETPVSHRGAAPIVFADLATEQVDVLVIGGGAAGLSAAIAARAGGLDVMVVDERRTTGGQYYKQTALALGAAPLDAQQREGAALRAGAERAGVRLRDGVEVIAALDPCNLLVTGVDRAQLIRTRTLVVATGAYERVIPIPGWTLPGVMTTGALQTLWRSYRALPGKRLLIAGNGPLNLQVGCEALAAGADVVAIAEAAPLMSPSRLGAAWRMMLADPALTGKGMALLARGLASAAKLRFGVVARRIDRQASGGLRIEIGPPHGGAGEIFEADAVALGYGFQPANELLRALGAAHHYDPAIGALRTERSTQFETSISHVFAVGDAAGLGGAPAAVAEGTIAGAAIAVRFGKAVPDEIRARVAGTGRALLRHRRFQAALWAFYGAPRPGLSLADDDTLVCRCEEIDKRTLVAAIGAGTSDIGEIKRRTRCGMGRCQGRYCGPLLVEHLAGLYGHAIDERSSFAPRSPFKPVTIADLVGRPRS